MSDDSQPSLLPQWWTLSGPDLMDMLRAVESGAAAEDVYLEWYVNSEITHVEGDEE